MNMIMSAVLLTTVIIAVATNQSNADNNKRLCGKQITKALMMICNGNYNNMDKKSIFNTADDYYNDQTFIMDDEYNMQYPALPFLHKLTGNAIIPKTRRLRQGVADECCKKPCTYAELSGYCRPN